MHLKTVGKPVWKPHLRAGMQEDENKWFCKNKTGDLAIKVKYFAAAVTAHRIPNPVATLVP